MIADEITTALRAFDREHGRAPLMVEWTNDNPDRQAILREFGTWKKAVHAAGLKQWHGSGPRTSGPKCEGCGAQLLQRSPDGLCGFCQVELAA